MTISTHNADKNPQVMGTASTQAEILCANYANIFTYLCGIIRDSDQAADTTQETFLKALQFLPYRGSDATLLDWLYGIATTTATSWLRENWSTCGDTWDETVGQGNAEQEDADAMPIPVRLVREALRLLPPHYRFPLTYQLRGFSISQIAEIMLLTPHQVNGRLMVARTALQRTYQDLRQRMEEEEHRWW